ncbi:hypothetical protein ACFY7C_06030 [Streptomyces sp. NPDC012769]|uniref:hypothetical protein n=1 Tax=Streptomyces sp. NPDC012769 TaxID=3364848 RepID=UPI0036D167E9
MDQTLLTKLLIAGGVFAAILLVGLLPMLLIQTPKEWCRTCKHQSYDHEGGTGQCTGDDFATGELAPSGTCRCWAYVSNREPR